MEGFRRAQRSGGLRAALCAFAAAAGLWALFLRPLPSRIQSAIPYALYVGAPPRTLVQGDHLQLLYHFDLLRSYVRGDLPWFRNLYEFNTSDDDIPPRPDPCYFPFALPYVLMREAGAAPALAWNLSQALSVLLGFLFCRALARRFGAGPAGATAAAALATCVPYRWVVLAGGSPTGFGMGLVPGVALGTDIAVRDGKARGGALAGALLVCCYAADLHCFLFASLAVPFWCVCALLRSPAPPFSSRRRSILLARALAPLAGGALLAAATGAAAKRAYASTSVAGGRTLAELEAHSPDWHAFFDPHYFSHYPDMFHMGRVLPAALFAAGLAICAAGALLLAGAIRGRRRTSRPHREALQPIVLHPAFSNRPAAAAPRWWERAEAARWIFAGLLLAAAIVATVALALGTHGPAGGLPLRALRKLVPPFRLVRQPLKAFCLLPTLYAPFFAIARAALRSLPANLRAAFPRAGGATAPVWMKRHWPLSTPFADAAADIPRRRAERVRRAAILALAALFVSVTALDGARGIGAGLCVLPPSDKAWAAAASAARARGETPRALVLPIWPGDSSWSSIYEYRAMQSGTRMLNGYAAVTRPDYVERVFRRFETMTEGDFTPDQAQGLREMGVTHIILQEDAFPPKVSLFSFGRTLRRHLENPALRLVANDGGSWVFEPCGEPSGAPPARPAALPAPTRVWTLPEPQTNAATRVRSFAAANSGLCGWLVRAEADKPLSLVTWAKGSASATTNAFPPVTGAKPGSWRLAWAPAPDPGDALWTHVATPGATRISYVAYAENPELPGNSPRPGPDASLELCAADLPHEFGTTVLDDSGAPCGLHFKPDGDAADARVAATGPRLPLRLPPGRYAVEPRSDRGGFAAATPEVLTDGTSPVDFAILWDGRTSSTLYSAILRPMEHSATEKSK